MRAARAPSGAWTLRLATREDTKQEAQASGDGDGLERIAPDGFLRLIGSLHRLVLRPVHLALGDAANGRGQVLKVGADCIDLVGEFIGVAATRAALGGTRADIAIGMTFQSFLPGEGRRG